MPDLIAHSADRSDAGRVRVANEDRVLRLDDAGSGAALYAVADGLGGHAGGEVASGLAVEILETRVRAFLAQRVSPRNGLPDAVRQANAAIHAEGRRAGRAGMATTCTAVVVARGEAVVAHVGDSRAYLLRGHAIRQLTRDHTLAGELARRSGVSAQDAERLAPRHVLARAVGMAPDVEVDTAVEPLRAGDLLVLTTDGVSNAVSPDELSHVVRAARDLDEACSMLIGLANARGGLDNASAVTVRLTARWLRRVLQVLAPVGLAAFVAAGVAADRLEHASFLGVRGDRVAVMRGVPGRLLGIPLSAVVKVTTVPVTQIAPAYRVRLVRGIPAASPEAAERMLPGLLVHSER